MSTDFAFGPFILDRQRGRLLREGRPIAVSSKGFQLLEALLGSSGRVLTKTELMRAAWGDTAVEESNLSVQIAALRKQLGPTADGGDWITTIPRVGYRFVGLPEKEPVEQIAESKALPGGREHRPSIAVLPFANLSGEKEQEYLADGTHSPDKVSLVLRHLTQFELCLQGQSVRRKADRARPRRTVFARRKRA